MSPYAESKWENEHQISKARDAGLEAVALRFFNVFGIGQRPDSAYAAVIPKWTESLINGKEIFINGDGKTSRDFCYIENSEHLIYSYALVIFNKKFEYWCSFYQFF